MSIVVLGGAGLIGNAIVRELLQRGHSVTAVGRRAAAPANLADLSSPYLSADTSTDTGMAEAIGDHDFVIDAAAPYALYLFDHAAGTRAQRQADAARRTDLLISGVARADAKLIYIGTQVSDPPPRRTGLFDLPLRMARAAHPYFSIKRMIDEKMARARAAGVAAVTVRPSACLGPWDARPVEQCWVPALLSGKLRVAVDHKVNIVDTRDVAIAVADTVDYGPGGPGIDVSGTDTTVRALFNQTCAAAGVPAPAFSVPAQFGVLPGLWSETVMAAMGMRSPLPGLIPLLICEQGRAVAGRDGPPPRPLSDTIRDTIEWYRDLDYC